MKQYAKNTRAGFTLIEMSIVLVIIGLVVGGIFLGISLKRSAEVQGIIGDEAKYVEAARQFKEKYGFPPGDFPNATSYWGTDPQGCPDVNPPYTTPQKTTCNGNGNGFITGIGSGTSDNTVLFETWRAWQQLADAGYIQGAYTGMPGPGCYTQDVPGMNQPATGIPGGGFEWNYYTTTSGYATPFAGPKYNTQYLLIGSISSSQTACGPLISPLLTPSEALAIDTKVDDGYPTTGLWLGGTPSSNICTTGNTTPLYNTTNYWSSYIPIKESTRICSMFAEVDW